MVTLLSFFLLPDNDSNGERERKFVQGLISVSSKFTLE
jgi:hypothetical protein